MPTLNHKLLSFVLPLILVLVVAPNSIYDHPVIWKYLCLHAKGIKANVWGVCLCIFIYIHIYKQLVILKQAIHTSYSKLQKQSADNKKFICK